jgi:DNA-binding ferritin-like protein (Dps family)
MNWKNIFKKIIDRSGKDYYDRYRFILKYIWNDPKIHDIIRLYNEYNLICI